MRWMRKCGPSSCSAAELRDAIVSDQLYLEYQTARSIFTPAESSASKCWFAVNPTRVCLAGLFISRRGKERIDFALGTLVMKILATDEGMAGRRVAPR